MSDVLEDKAFGKSLKRLIKHLKNRRASETRDQTLYFLEQAANVQSQLHDDQHCGSSPPPSPQAQQQRQSGGSSSLYKRGSQAESEQAADASPQQHGGRLVGGSFCGWEWREEESKRGQHHPGAQHFSSPPPSPQYRIPQRESPGGTYRRESKAEFRDAPRANLGLALREHHKAGSGSISSYDFNSGIDARATSSLDTREAAAALCRTADRETLVEVVKLLQGADPRNKLARRAAQQLAASDDAPLMPPDIRGTSRASMSSEQHQKQKNLAHPATDATALGLLGSGAGFEGKSLTRASLLQINALAEAVDAVELGAQQYTEEHLTLNGHVLQRLLDMVHSVRDVTGKVSVQAAHEEIIATCSIEERLDHHERVVEEYKSRLVPVVDRNVVFQKGTSKDTMPKTLSSDNASQCSFSSTYNKMWYTNEAWVPTVRIGGGYMPFTDFSWRHGRGAAMSLLETAKGKIGPVAAYRRHRSMLTSESSGNSLLQKIATEGAAATKESIENESELFHGASSGAAPPDTLFRRSMSSAWRLRRSLLGHVIEIQ